MKKTFKISSIVLSSLIVLAFIGMMITEITPIGLGMHDSVYSKDEIALSGYDVVSYFDETPELGNKEHSYNYDGANWYFKSDENRKSFQSNPEKYMPQFGGYCSKAVSTGFTAPSDPTVFAIYNDRLYVFSSEEVKLDFEKNPDAIISACTENWN